MTVDITALKPSELIRVALADLEAVEKDERYRVDMGIWHSGYEDDGVCEVCLAGAVMARTLGANHEEVRMPIDFYGPVGKRLHALDDFRCGDILQGLISMDIPMPNDIAERVYIEPYEWNHTQFKANMRIMADYLESYGL